MIALFLLSLTKALDNETPDWRENTVFLWDGASYHKSAETKAIMLRLGLKVIYSGPYSYSATSAEYLFGTLKNNEFNRDRIPTGKK